MKIKWKEEAGTKKISIHGSSGDFSAEFDPEAIYDVSQIIANELIKTELFEIATERRTKRKFLKEEEEKENE